MPIILDIIQPGNVAYLAKQLRPLGKFPSWAAFVRSEGAWAERDLSY